MSHPPVVMGGGTGGVDLRGEEDDMSPKKRRKFEWTHYGDEPPEALEGILKGLDVSLKRRAQGKNSTTLYECKHSKVYGCEYRVKALRNDETNLYTIHTTGIHQHSNARFYESRVAGLPPDVRALMTELLLKDMKKEPKELHNIFVQKFPKAPGDIWQDNVTMARIRHFKDSLRKSSRRPTTNTLSDYDSNIRRGNIDTGIASPLAAAANVADGMASSLTAFNSVSSACSHTPATPGFNSGSAARSRATTAESFLSNNNYSLPNLVVAAGVARLPTFSSAAVIGECVFVSGTLGTVPWQEGEAIRLGSSDIANQTRQTLSNIRQILTSSFESEGRVTNQDVLRHVGKVNVYLKPTTVEAYDIFNEVYLEFFGTVALPPARICVSGVTLGLDALVEIECVASLPKRRG